MPVNATPGPGPDAASPPAHPGSAQPLNHDEPKPPDCASPPTRPPHASPPSIAVAALNFFTNATPTTLAAVGVASIAVAFALFGRLGLLLMGALGGVAVFVSCEFLNPRFSAAVRPETGTQALDRLWLELQATKPLSSNDDSEAEDERPTAKSFDDFRPQTREALASLVDAVIRDYVKWWYTPIIPTDRSFPLACRKTLTSYLLAVSNRISRKRPTDMFLDLLTNCSSITIVLLSELAAAFADLPPDSNMTAADAVYNYLASNPDSRLANLLSQKQQAVKFRTVAEDLLIFLEANSRNCDPVRLFLREILANSVLETALQTCSQAEWINGWIVYLLEAGEPDLSQAIDVGMQSGRDLGNNLFADLDGNVGNINIQKPGRSASDAERGRRKDSVGHKKKLSRADEELEEAAAISIPDAHPPAPPHPDDVMHEAKSLKPSPAPTGVSDASETPCQNPSPPSLSSDGFSSSRSEAADAPATPQSNRDLPGLVASPASPQSLQGLAPQQQQQHQFTSFDQIVSKPSLPRSQADGTDDDAPKKVPLTLHNAAFTLHDDASGDKNRIRGKPSWDYLIQVEPSSAAHSGWMIVRRYSDFQTLHEILRRIATISGATAFMELHTELPSWKMHTRESLRGELERYLRDACWYQSLAESEGMKRFLEKSQGHSHESAKTFGWEAVGKNVLDVFTTAPKGAVEGSKNLVGGVGGVLGNLSGLSKKPSSGLPADPSSSPSRLPTSASGRIDSPRMAAQPERPSLDSQRSTVISTQPKKIPPMERRPSLQSQGDADSDQQSPFGRPDRTEPASASASNRQSRDHSRTSSQAPARTPSSVSLDLLKLPPPPDEMTDEYEASVGGDSRAAHEAQAAASFHHPRSLDSGTPNSSQTRRRPATNGTSKSSAKAPAATHAPLSEPETRVAVELLFAVINEMYTLSSAWNIRRTLLTAAKSFLLRPGNPSLATLQSLIQASLLDAHTSDAGVAAQLRKARQNALPTDAERAAWPSGLSPDDKEALARKARRLLIQSGLPAALMGVMGQAATSEALGRVFDCLQIEEVARGLMFGLMLQAVRILTH